MFIPAAVYISLFMLYWSSLVVGVLENTALSFVFTKGVGPLAFGIVLNLTVIALLYFVPLGPIFKRHMALLWILSSLVLIALIGYWGYKLAIACRTLFNTIMAGCSGLRYVLQRASRSATAPKALKFMQSMEFHEILEGVCKMIGAAYVQQVLDNFEPLGIIFWFGNHYFVVVVALVVFPTILGAVVLPIQFGYYSVLRAGGDGTERVKPSQIKWFYSQAKWVQDRIRKEGLTNVEQKAVDRVMEMDREAALAIALTGAAESETQPLADADSLPHANR